MDLCAESSSDIAHYRTPTIVSLAKWVRYTLGDDCPCDTNGIWQAGDYRRGFHWLGQAIQTTFDLELVWLGELLLVHK